jgi:hypothetical protein
MGRIWAWIRRRGALAGFAAGALLTPWRPSSLPGPRGRAAIGAVPSAALTQALSARWRSSVAPLGPGEGPSLRLSAKAGWPADVPAESVEASAPRYRGLVSPPRASW